MPVCPQPDAEQDDGAVPGAHRAAPPAAGREGPGRPGDTGQHTAGGHPPRQGRPHTDEAGRHPPQAVSWSDRKAAVVVVEGVVVVVVGGSGWWWLQQWLWW